MTERSWFVGIDWATEEHAVCLIDDAGDILGKRAFPHSGDGLADLCSWLVTTTGASSLASMFVAPTWDISHLLLLAGAVLALAGFVAARRDGVFGPRVTPLLPVVIAG